MVAVDDQRCPAITDVSLFVVVAVVALVDELLVLRFTSLVSLGEPLAGLGALPARGNVFAE